jgi:putative membrane protein
MFPVRLFFLVGLLATSSAALAHSGHEHSDTPGWTVDPIVTVPLAALLLLFLVGRWRLGRRSKLPRSRTWLFLGGWLILSGALVSPLHQGGERSFTLHMIEHEMIMLLATLLLAAASAGGVLAWGLPAPVRDSLSGRWRHPLVAIWRRLTEPVTATILQALVMWAWHAPALFNRALMSQGWHIAQHASFILASYIFWRAMLDVRRSGYLVSALCLFLTSLVEGVLGALMSLSESPWYAAYAAMGMSGIGLDPVSDQQLAGLIMWIPGGLVHGAAALAFLYRWLSMNEDSDAVRSN